ncbi:glycosyltransferase family 2 protein [Pseudotabrizicola sp. L79]|uniref:glycosyltransferase family 2 protein n=1 Tax=Pseudotabrizicola sp. L79 TaxID=3118402 RepID=UPI002F948434
MRYTSLSDFLSKGKAALAKGPVAVVFAEDDIEIDTTLRHHQRAGFREVLLFAPAPIVLPDKLEATVHRIDHNVHAEAALITVINSLIRAAPGIWLFYCYNGEYLFHPFCEDRNIRELLAFHTEERREALLTYVIDLYAGDLDSFPNAVSLEDAHLDRSGYYALGRPDPANKNHPKERQLDFFGGLRWRFEEHVPWERRKIDRICLFKTKPGLELRPDYTLNDEEMNTYACPWHNNLTTALASFRTAKALRTNPGSRYDIHDFKWRNTVPFEWHSQQLMDLGLMEPGQWF